MWPRKMLLLTLCYWNSISLSYFLALLVFHSLYTLGSSRTNQISMIWYTWIGCRRGYTGRTTHCSRYQRTRSDLGIGHAAISDYRQANAQWMGRTIQSKSRCHCQFGNGSQCQCSHFDTVQSSSFAWRASCGVGSSNHKRQRQQRQMRRHFSIQ